MNKFLAIAIICCLIAAAASCRKGQDKTSGESLFTLLDSAKTHINFENTLRFKKDFNLFTYMNFHDGGGVSLGDINNDGLVDVFFSSNMDDNKLYLNQGGFKFRDITNSAGVAGKKSWSTGVSMVDINGDNLLDIYVCNAGNREGENRRNELYINNGDTTFTEQASKYGLTNPGYSTQAAFFDYDGDGDLDMYQLNYRYRPIGPWDRQKNLRNEWSRLGGDKLLRNDDGKFVDVTKAAGIFGNQIGLGMGVTVGDVNRDGRPDLYISNDFFERDYLYINNGDGTFTESLINEMNSISLSSMGSDEADLNNDGYPEIFVTDMLPDQEFRLKTVTTFRNWKKYQEKVNIGYYHQFTRNTLQMNNKAGSFSEIGRLAGVDATDWSWGALMMDMDNDGFNDIFVSNGIYKDITDIDYLQHISREKTRRQLVKGHNVDYKKLIDMIPSTPLPNHAFKNEGDLHFGSKAAQWGLDTPGFSSGAAYGDLDNDGDLDLVVNNVNMPAFVYQNNADSLLNNHYLQLKLVGSKLNTQAIGAQVTLKANGQKFYRELMPVRGFESSVDPRLHFGLGKIQEIDTLLIQWPEGQTTTLNNIHTDTLLTISQRETAKARPVSGVKKKDSYEKPIFQPIKAPKWKHQEDNFNDFKRTPLLFQMRSTEGPKGCKGDLDGDGREDVFVGGAKGQAGALFLQSQGNSFIRSNKSVFNADKISEDSGCAFLDANGDGHMDLYVGSGSNEFPVSSSALADRLYLNNGNGKLYRTKKQLLPAGRYESTGPVEAIDYDKDGDTDLFVGIRLHPFEYGKPGNGYILQNDGKGHFTNVTAKIAPGLEDIGMITAAQWTDYDGDGRPDLLIAGEWMPLTLFHNENGTFVNVTDQAGLKDTNGWWKSLAQVDLNNDGSPDYVAGNYGLNSRFHATKKQPLRLFYFNDLNQYGMPRQVITHYVNGKSYPMALQHNLQEQFPALKSRYPTHASFSDQTTMQIFGRKALNKAMKLKAVQLASVWLENEKDGTFKVHKLPLQAQLAPVYALLPGDFDGDGNDDILLGGNLDRVKPQIGSYNATYGVYLKGDGHSHLKSVDPLKSGLKVQGRIRALVRLKMNQKSLILIALNNDSLQVYSENESVAGDSPK